MLTAKQVVNPVVNLTTAYEGQVHIVVHALARVTDGWEKAEATVKELLRIEGKVFAFKRLSSAVDGVFRAIAEFCDVNSSFTAVSKLHGIKHEV